ncbi:MAG: calcium-binding protein [Pseudomonadota bacterium]
MSILDASGATEGLNMLDGNRIAFDQQDPGGVNSAVQYSWLTPFDDDVQVTGSGITFAGGEPTGGTVTEMDIDLGDNNFSNPDVTITNIPNADLVTMTTGSPFDLLNEVFSSNDSLTGSDFNDNLKGLGGNDTFIGSDGDDTLSGGGGNDTFRYIDGQGADEGETINGDSGTDILQVQTSNNSDVFDFRGFDANSIEEIEFNADGANRDKTIQLGAGEFTSNTEFATDLVIDGNDNAGAVDLIEIYFNDPGDSSPISLDISGWVFDDWGSTASTDAGQAETIRIVGDSDAETVVGSSEIDVMRGRGGDDDLSGNGGKDDLRGGDGGDDIRGGDGGDTLRGDKGKDDLRGDQGSDDLRGGDGGDTLRGGKGSDELRGNDGKDSLRGGDGDDTLNGGGEDDVVRGDAGKDILTGGNGSDTFDFNAPSDSGKGGSNADDITDFKKSEDDVIDLKGLVPGKITFRGDKNFKQGETNQLILVDTGDDVRVRIDFDGDQDSDFDIDVLDINNLREVDFLL